MKNLQKVADEMLKELTAQSPTPAPQQGVSRPSTNVWEKAQNRVFPYKTYTDFILNGKSYKGEGEKQAYDAVDKFYDQYRKYQSQLESKLAQNEFNNLVYSKEALDQPIDEGIVKDFYEKGMVFVTGRLGEFLSTILKDKFNQIQSNPLYAGSGSMQITQEEPWTVGQWKQLLMFLFNRAQDQYKKAKNKSRSVNPIEKKNAEAEVVKKEQYMALVKNLWNKLNQLAQNNSLNDGMVLNDSLLFGSPSYKGGDKEGKGRRARTDSSGRRIIEYIDEGEEGEEKSTKSDQLKTAPLSKGKIWIKELVRAYGLDSDILLSRDAPDYLDYGIWAEGYHQDLNNFLNRFNLGEQQKARYINDLINNLAEMQRRYMDYVRQKKLSPNEKQLEMFGSLISNIRRALKNFPV